MSRTRRGGITHRLDLQGLDAKVEILVGVILLNLAVAESLWWQGWQQVTVPSPGLQLSLFLRVKIEAVEVMRQNNGHCRKITLMVAGGS